MFRRGSVIAQPSGWTSRGSAGSLAERSQGLSAQAVLAIQWL